MKNPVAVRVDLENRLAYVSYLADAKITASEDIWEEGRVAADFDDAGDVVGIEVLGLDDETLAHAKAFAVANGLGFPINLAGTLVAA